MRRTASPRDWLCKALTAGSGREIPLGSPDMRGVMMAAMALRCLHYIPKVQREQTGDCTEWVEGEGILLEVGEPHCGLMEGDADG